MDNTLSVKFKEEDCDDETKLYSKKCNKLLLKKELIERDYLKENPDENTSLYPDLNDPNFNVKIATRKEFNDYKKNKNSINCNCNWNKWYCFYG